MPNHLDPDEGLYVPGLGRTLPPVLDIPDAAMLLGYGRARAWQLVTSGTWPTPLIRVGPRRVKVPTAAVLRLLELSFETKGESS